MKLVGIALIIIGLIDLIGSHMGFDLWGGFLGIELPDLLWNISAYIEMGVGYFFIQVSDDEASEGHLETE